MCIPRAVGFFLLTLSFSTTSLHLKAQRNEIGGGIGIANYVGDINNNINFLFTSPAIHGFYRYNFSGAVVWRLQAAYFSLYATDNVGGDPYQAIRQATFSKAIWEAATLVEYNFLSFRNPKRGQFWSPYWFGGFSIFRMPGSVPRFSGGAASSFQPAIPFGVGIKVAYRGPWNIGLEFGARKTFTDYLDNLGDSYSSTGFQRAIPDSKDWYYHTTINLSYTFLEIDCKVPFIY
jgi:hypothetical protein